jgi:hypothetical protein
MLYSGSSENMLTTISLPSLLRNQAFLFNPYTIQNMGVMSNAELVHRCYLQNMAYASLFGGNSAENAIGLLGVSQQYQQSSVEVGNNGEGAVIDEKQNRRVPCDLEARDKMLEGAALLFEIASGGSSYPINTLKNLSGAGAGRADSDTDSISTFSNSTLSPSPKSTSARSDDKSDISPCCISDDSNYCTAEDECDYSSSFVVPSSGRRGRVAKSLPKSKRASFQQCPHCDYSTWFVIHVVLLPFISFVFDVHFLFLGDWVTTKPTF